jgi:hypothetical protein
MTWVVGASTFLGFGIMVSDVRVSWASGGEADLLRKAYPVAPLLLAGFAGSVRIGFQLLGSLQHFLKPPGIAHSGAWKPEWVADNWYPLAAQIFANAPPEEQECHSQFLLVGVSPDEDMGVPEFARTYLIRMEAPGYRPAYFPKGMSVCHIGSGSDVSDFVEAIAEVADVGSPTMQAAAAGAPAWAQMIGHSVGRLVQDDPQPGISPHVHIQICSRRGFEQGANDFTRGYPDGRRVEFRMPQVASNWQQFLALCQQQGRTAALARA